MPTSYTSQLRISLPATGENSGTWGTLINTQITALLEQAIAGVTNISMTSDANYTMSSLNGASDEARSIALNVTSTVSLTAQRDILAPAVGKTYVVSNNTTGGQSIRVKSVSGTGVGVVVPNGATLLVWSDGAGANPNFNAAVTGASNFNISGNLTMSGSGARILGDFSGVSSVRAMFATSLTDGATAVGAIPNGAGTSAVFQAFSSSTPGNSSYLQFGTNGTTDTRIISGFLGSGSYLPISIYTSNTARLTIPVAGGLTINAPTSGTALIVDGTAASSITSAFRATGATGSAALYLQHLTSGVTSVWTSESVGGGTQCLFGTQTNHSLQVLTNNTARLGISNAGNVTVNAPSSGTALTVNAISGNTALAVLDGTATSAWFTNGASGVSFGTTSAHTLNLMTGGFNVRQSISAAGNVTINAPSSGTALTVNGTITNVCTSTATANFTGNQASASVTSQNTGTGYAAFSVQSAASQTAYMFFNTTGFGETARLQAGASGSLDICTNTAAAVRISISSVGAVTINAPSSGDTLSLNVLAGGHNAWAASDGTVSTQCFLNGAAGVVVGVGTNHPLNITTNNTTRIAIAAAGEVTLNASTSGNRHLVNQQGGSWPIGYLNLPQSASTTATGADVGKSIVATSTITIPNSTFAAGDCFTIYNNSAAAITLTCNTTTTRIAGTATTGTTRTLAQRGQCTAYFLSATELILSGNVT